MKARRLLSLSHRYLGLLLLVEVVILSLTGSLLAFAPELDRLLNPELLQAHPLDPGTPPQPLAAQLAAAEAHQRAGGGPPWQASSLVPAQAEGSVSSVWFRRPDPDRPGKFVWRQVLVDPLAGRVLGHRDRSRLELSRAGAIHLLDELHGKLLLGEPGRWITGLAGVAWCLTSLVGLYLWWPGRRKLQLALTVKRKAGPARFMFDLHRAAGFYSLPLLVVIAFTGIYLSLPATVKPLVAAVAEVDERAPPPVEPVPGGAIITPDESVARAAPVFPGAELKRIGLPDARGAYAVVFRQPEEVQRASGGRSVVWIDPYRGAVLQVKDGRRLGAGDVFLAWQTPLHTGSAFGLTGRILVLLSGLVGCLMGVSGMLIWVRRPSRRHRAVRAQLRPRDSGGAPLPVLPGGVAVAPSRPSAP